MSLSGNIRTMPLPDLLQWLAAATKTGVVSFNRGGTEKKLFFDEGKIVGASSNDPTDFIGQWLVSCGRITEDQLRIALGEQERSNTFLGTILVQMRALSEQEVSVVLAMKAEEILYGLFHWEEGSFEFHDGEFEKLPFRISLSIQDVLLKGLRRFDEMQVIRKEFPDATVVLQRTSSPMPQSVMANPHARNITESIDGARPIAAIALHTHTSEFIVSKFLHELLRAGLVEIVKDSASAASRTRAAGSAGLSGNGFLAPARKLLDRRDYEGALKLLSGATQDDREARSLIEEAEAGLVEHLYRLHLPQDKIPLLARPLSDLMGENLSPEEFYLLSRIDGEWNLRSIVTISPLREVEALRVLNRLRERGVITFK